MVCDIFLPSDWHPTGKVESSLPWCLLSLKGRIILPAGSKRKEKNTTWNVTLMHNWNHLLALVLTWEGSLQKCSLQNGCCSRPPGPDTHPSPPPHAEPPTWPPLDGAACMPPPSWRCELSPTPSTTVGSAEHNRTTKLIKMSLRQKRLTLACDWDWEGKRNQQEKPCLAI